MSKKSNPTLIGSFVVGGVALLALAVALFGGAELFAPRGQAVSYFPGNVKGLRVGANVLLQGVRVGFVEDIQLLGDVDTLETLVRVDMELLTDQFKLTRGGMLLDEHDPVVEAMTEQDLIDAGLRARLETESFVTGQLLVQLELLPDTPAVYRGNHSGSRWEVPSVPSNVEQILDNIQTFVRDFSEKIDMDKLLADIQGIGSGLNELANSEDLRASLAGANQLINDAETQNLPEDLDAALNELRGTLRDARKLVNNADDQLGPLVDEIIPMIDSMDDALVAGEEALKNASAQIRGDTQIAHQLGTTMEELSATARSLRVLLDTIERNPESLLRGKRE